MKKISLLLFLSFLSLITVAQNKKIAILETVDKKGDIPYSICLQLRSNLTYAITNTPGYEGYDRVDVSQIMGEHNFQRTGMVSDEQIKKLGEMTGCSSILITEVAYIDKNQIIITAKILNVETANVENSTPAQISDTNPDELQRACVRLARLLLGNNSPVDGNTMISEPQKNNYTGNNRLDITKQGNFYYLGNIRMNKKEYADYLQSNCPDAYKYYLEGCGNTKAGRILLFVSGGLIVAGAITGGVMGIGFNQWDDGGEVALAAGLSLGAQIAAISTPFFIIGKNKKNKAIKTFNEKCSWSTTSLSFGPTGNGVGVSLNF